MSAFFGRSVFSTPYKYARVPPQGNVIGGVPEETLLLIGAMQGRQQLFKDALGNVLGIGGGPDYRGQNREIFEQERAKEASMAQNLVAMEMVRRREQEEERKAKEREEERRRYAEAQRDEARRYAKEQAEWERNLPENVARREIDSARAESAKEEAARLRAYRDLREGGVEVAPPGGGLGPPSWRDATPEEEALALMTPGERLRYLENQRNKQRAAPLEDVQRRIAEQQAKAEAERLRHQAALEEARQSGEGVSPSAAELGMGITKEEVAVAGMSPEQRLEHEQKKAAAKDRAALAERKFLFAQEIGRARAAAMAERNGLFRDHALSAAGREERQRFDRVRSQARQEVETELRNSMQFDIPAEEIEARISARQMELFRQAVPDVPPPPISNAPAGSVRLPFRRPPGLPQEIAPMPGELPLDAMQRAKREDAQQLGVIPQLQPPAPPAATPEAAQAEMFEQAVAALDSAPQTLDQRLAYVATLTPEQARQELADLEAVRATVPPDEYAALERALRAQIGG